MVEHIRRLGKISYTFLDADTGQKFGGRRGSNYCFPCKPPEIIF